MRHGHGSIGHLRDLLFSAVRGAGKDASAVEEAVAATVAVFIRDAGQVGIALLETISETASAAVRAADQVDGDIASVAKGYTMGVARGAGQTREAALKTLSHAAATFLKHVELVGDDAERAARGLAAGALACAQDIGVESSRAASAVGQACGDAANGSSKGRR